MFRVYSCKGREPWQDPDGDLDTFFQRFSPEIRLRLLSFFLSTHYTKSRSFPVTWYFVNQELGPLSLNSAVSSFDLWAMFFNWCKRWFLFSGLTLHILTFGFLWFGSQFFGCELRGDLVLGFFCMTRATSVYATTDSRVCRFCLHSFIHSGGLPEEALSKI